MRATRKLELSAYYDRLITHTKRDCQMANEVHDNASQSRFELTTDKGTAFIAYRQSGNVLSLDHTEVPESMAGQGIGSAIVKGALDLIRQRGQKIVAQCSFVERYLEKNPGERELEVQAER